MTKNRKKIISKVVASGMLISNIPIQTFANEIKDVIENTEEIVNNEENTNDNFKEGGENYIDENLEDYLNEKESLENTEDVIDSNILLDNSVVIEDNESDNENILAKESKEVVTFFSGGDGTELNPYLISSAEELYQLSNQVNNGSLDTTNLHYKLTADIDFSSFDIDSDGTVDSFEPIGNNWGKEFKGHFDGDNHTISNIKIESTYNSTGLFGVVQNTSMKNLKMENVTIINGSNSGALVGYSNNDLTIENVSVNNLIIENSQVYYGAGLVGHAGGNNTTKISDCSIKINSEIKSEMGYVGGLIGYSNSNLEISNINITGNFTGKSGAGGLIGYSGEMYGNLNPKILKVSNIEVNANVNQMSGSSNTGGIIGNLTVDSVKEGYNILLNEIHFKGKINNNIDNAYGMVGGIIGYVSTPTGMTINVSNNSIELEHVKGQYVGGLIGFVNANIVAKNNTVVSNESILNPMYFGGAFGNQGTDRTAEVENFKFNGNVLVQNNTYAGGIAGQSGVMKVKNVDILGEIKGDFRGVQAGGLVGWLGSNTLEADSVNIKLNILTPSSMATGGYIGYSSADNIRISKSSYEGILEGQDSVGGIVGYAKQYGNLNMNIENTYILGEIKASKNAGGFIGYTYSSTPSSVVNIVSSYLAVNFDESTPTSISLISDIDDKVVASNVYYDSTKTTLTNDKLQPLTTTQMQGKEAQNNMNLDFINIWKLNKEYYPTFEQINTAPNIIVNPDVKDNTIVINQYNKFDISKYVTTEDFEGDEVTLTIKSVKESFDTSKYGLFPITVVATDSKGLSSELALSLKINPLMIKVNEAPIIIAEDITLTVGDEFNPLKVIAVFDKEDGILTSTTKVIENTVNMNKAGVYKVTYEVTDKDGAKATKTITVTVKEKVVSNNNPNNTTTTDDKKDTNTTEKPQTSDIGLMGLTGILVSTIGLCSINRKKEE